MRRVLVALAVAGAVLAAALTPALAVGLLTLAPALLLLGLLANGRYVGVQQLARLRSALRGRRRRPAPAVPTAPLRPAPFLPRGGRLIAAALAVRPPPHARPAR